MGKLASFKGGEDMGLYRSYWQNFGPVVYWVYNRFLPRPPGELVWVRLWTGWEGLKARSWLARMPSHFEISSRCWVCWDRLFKNSCAKHRILDRFDWYLLIIGFFYFLL